MKAAWWSNVKIVTQKKQASMKQISKPVFLRCGKITEVVRVCLKNAFRTPRRQSGMNFGYVTMNGVNSNDLLDLVKTQSMCYCQVQGKRV